MRMTAFVWLTAPAGMWILAAAWVLHTVGAWPF